MKTGKLFAVTVSSLVVVVGVGWASVAKAEDSVFSDPPASSVPSAPVATDPASLTVSSESSQKAVGKNTSVSNHASKKNKHHKKGRGHKKTSTKQAKHSTHKKHHKKA